VLRSGYTRERFSPKFSALYLKVLLHPIARSMKVNAVIAVNAVMEAGVRAQVMPGTKVRKREAENKLC
jgi:hypothetical protein